MGKRMHKVNVIRLGIEKFVSNHCSHSLAAWIAIFSLPLPAAFGRQNVDDNAHPKTAYPLRPGEHAPQDAGIILERPLFATTRRPPPGPRESAAGPADTMPRLSGIIIAASYRRAIFDGNGHPTAYAEGDRVGRYEIVAIGQQQVTVNGPDGQKAISLSFDANRPLAGGAATPPGPSILDRLNSHAAFHPVMPKMPTLESLMAHVAQPPK